MADDDNSIGSSSYSNNFKKEMPQEGHFANIDFSLGGRKRPFCSYFLAPVDPSAETFATGNNIGFSYRKPLISDDSSETQSGGEEDAIKGRKRRHTEKDEQIDLNDNEEEEEFPSKKKLRKVTWGIIQKEGGEDFQIKKEVEREEDKLLDEDLLPKLFQRLDLNKRRSEESDAEDEFPKKKCLNLPGCSGLSHQTSHAECSEQNTDSMVENIPPFEAFRLQSVRLVARKRLMFKNKALHKK